MTSRAVQDNTNCMNLARCSNRLDNVHNTVVHLTTEFPLIVTEHSVQEQHSCDRLSSSHSSFSLSKAHCVPVHLNPLSSVHDTLEAKLLRTPSCYARGPHPS